MRKVLQKPCNCIALATYKVCFPLQPVFLPFVSSDMGCETPVVLDKRIVAWAAAAAHLCLLFPFHSPRSRQKAALKNYWGMILKLWLIIRRHIQLRDFSMWGDTWSRKSNIWLGRASVFVQIWKKFGSLVWSYMAYKSHSAHVFNSSCSLLGIFHLNVSMVWINTHFLLQSVRKRWWWWWCKLIF